MSENTAANIYQAGHAESVLSTHRWRTIANSVAYVLPYLQPDMKILDVGCGPGSITVDLAKHVPQGEVIGIDVAAPLPGARELAVQEGVSNVRFEEGEAHALAYPDDSFDLVHAHQVLQHLADPVTALKEMRRVVKPSGFVACRESAKAFYYPESAALKAYEEVYRKMRAAKGAHPHAGSYIHVWAQQAGFPRNRIKCSAGSWCFSSAEERQYWGGSHIKRIEESDMPRKAIEEGYTTKEELAMIADGWRAFIEDENGWYSFLHGEIVCQK